MCEICTVMSNSSRVILRMKSVYTAPDSGRILFCYNKTDSSTFALYNLLHAAMLSSGMFALYIEIVSDTGHEINTRPRAKCGWILQLAGNTVNLPATLAGSQCESVMCGSLYKQPTPDRHFQLTRPARNCSK